MDAFIESMLPDGIDDSGYSDDPKKNFWGKFWAIILGGYCF
jgi:hypothetical protein